MRRFILIALAQDTATVVAMWILLRFFEGVNSLGSDLIRLTFMVLTTPLAWVGMSVGSSLDLMPVTAAGLFVSSLVAFLPNALLWSAVICWWLNRRARRLHGVGIDRQPA